jgi:hypothetical protein
VTPGKGRPTPKRREAERQRRYTAPGDRKSAVRQSRGRDREARSRKTEAMRRGEEWALPARDKGPVKALARDYVDAKRRISEFYMYGLIVLLLVLFAGKTLQSYLPPVLIAMVLIMAVEGFFLGRRVARLAAERYPGESTRGVKMYAAMRALQIRKLRFPKPRVKPGDSF